MEINVTVFIQAFHFFVAYLILEKLLFRPTIKDITQEQKQYNDLVTTINAQHKILKDKEDRKKLEWNNFKLFFAKAIPQLVTKEHHIRIGTVQPASIMTQPEQEKYEKVLQEALVKRLSHVS